MSDQPKKPQTAVLSFTDEKKCSATCHWDEHANRYTLTLTNLDDLVLRVDINPEHAEAIFEALDEAMCYRDSSTMYPVIDRKHREDFIWFCDKRGIKFTVFNNDPDGGMHVGITRSEYEKWEAQTGGA